MSKVENLIFDPRLGHPDLPEASLGATRSRLNINSLNPVLLLNLLFHSAPLPSGWQIVLHSDGHRKKSSKNVHLRQNLLNLREPSEKRARITQINKKDSFDS